MPRQYSSSSSSSDSSSSSQQPKYTEVKVHNLTINVNDDHLKEIFGIFGPISCLGIRHSSKKYGLINFVNLKDAEEAVKCMNKGWIDGQIVIVSLDDGKDEQKKKGQEKKAEERKGEDKKKQRQSKNRNLRDERRNERKKEKSVGRNRRRRHKSSSSYSSRSSS